MTFKDLNLISQLQKAVEKQGYTEPTPIQAQTIPLLLEGKDVMGIAQTGTGKTAAFTLPILQGLFKNKKPLKPGFPRALILTPTRELAAQIEDSFKNYGQFLDLKHTVIFGGVNQHSQVRRLSKGVDILVATPGRLLDLMNQKHINLKEIEYFILDEADRMLDMGFVNDVRKVIAVIPKKRHSLFFSATMSKDIEKLAKSMLINPEHIEVTPQATTVEKIEQKVFFIDADNKNYLLKKLMKEDHHKSVLIFTRTKHRANKVSEVLNKNNVSSAAIHGNKSQNQRTKALADFKSGKVKVLVATDIAARGIDINKISHVINYDLPNEAESYVHRIGRTARAGEEGTAYSFCAADERDFLRAIERLIKMQIPVEDHKYHSEKAKNATGAAAKFVIRRNQGGRRRQSRGRYGGNSRGGSNRGSSSGYKGKSNSRYKSKSNESSSRRNSSNNSESSSKPKSNYKKSSPGKSKGPSSKSSPKKTFRKRY